MNFSRLYQHKQPPEIVGYMHFDTIIFVRLFLYDILAAVPVLCNGVEIQSNKIETKQ